MRTALCDPQGLQLGSSGTGVFGYSCLPKAVTGVSQPGVGLESAYSGPRVELRPPVYPSPVFRADLALVGAVHPGGGGNQRRRGYRVGDCSAEGGTRLGCVRGALGSICFITRLAHIPLSHAVPRAVVPFYYLRLSHRTLRPVSIGAKGVAFYYAYWYGMRTCLAFTVEWCPPARLPSP